VTDHPLPDTLDGAHALIRAMAGRVEEAEARARTALVEADGARRTAQVDAALAKAARIALEVEIEQLKF